MINSMTGYGKSNFTDENINFDLEIKAVNSRYLDINIKMPYQLNFLEEKINKFIKNKLNRGRVDVFIRSKNNQIGNSKISIDDNALSNVSNSINKIMNDFSVKNTRVEISEILLKTGVLSFESEVLDEKYLSNAIISCLDDAISDLLKMREKEGENLYNDLVKNLSILEDKKSEISEYAINIKDDLRDKIYKNISDILEDIKIDQDRLANEIVYYADKTDISEELSRLTSHFELFRSTLNSNQSVGKKLDFICQELLRETNTIASKASKIEITNIVIDMKTVIEKLKEQVQNIE